MLANLARAVAASSAVRLVASPMLIMVWVKLVMSPVAMPSWPAASATAAISVVVAGISVDISIISSEMATSCSSVPSTVLYTPVMALSYSMAASVASLKALAIWERASPMPAATITSLRLIIALEARSPKAWAASAASSCFCRSSPIWDCRRSLSCRRLLVSTPASDKAASSLLRDAVSSFSFAVVFSIWAALAARRFSREEEKPSVSWISRWMLSYWVCSSSSRLRVASAAACCFW